MSIANLKTRLFNKGRSIFLKTANKIVPKKNNRVVFASLPDYSDNSKGLWEYMNTLPGYETVWLVRNKDLVPKLSKEGLVCHYEYSWEGMRFLLTSKFIVCTHSQFIDIKSSKQKLINLWHGMPLKAMGYLDNSCNARDIEDFKRVSTKSDIMIATSTLMKYVMTGCFNIDPRRVVVTGQPRNDQLFKPVDRAMLDKVLGDKAGKYDRYILYCPTFRVGMGRVEGKKFSGNVFNFTDYDKTTLDNLLKSQNALLVIKLHPFEEKQYNDGELDLPDNAILVRSDVFNCNMLSIYDILALFDVLITDYSSIYFDYLLLDKPIVFTANDLKEYKSGRGLVFDNYDFWAPGPKACSFSELLPCLDNSLSDKDYFKQERAMVNEMVNGFTDGGSAGRVVDVLKKLQ
jgi:CDP-glycerol glycerophosphotransferase